MLDHCVLLNKSCQSGFGPDMTEKVDKITQPDPTLISLLLPVFYQPIIWRKRRGFQECQRGKIIHIIYDI